MQIQYLGQAGFKIDGTGSTYLIDPYLSDYVISGGYGSSELFSRNFPPPIQPEDLLNIDAIFITHDHADHCDVDSLKIINKNNPNCKIIGPKPVRDKITSFTSTNDSIWSGPGLKGQVENGIEFIPVPAAHPFYRLSDASEEPDCVGYLIKMEGAVVYHSGDTVLYDGMARLIKESGWKIDIACLPVNGRDEKREKMGIVGNLNVEESLQLATSIGAKWMIPIHNDLFSINQENPAYVDSILNSATDLKIVKMTPGQRVEFY